MKFQLAVAALLSCVLAVQANAVYHAVFTNNTMAENCLSSNAAYLKKVADIQYVADETLYLVDLEDACNDVIFEEIEAVCGNLVSTDCSEA